MKPVAPFFRTLAHVVGATLFIVMALAFVTIPYSLAGHPGEFSIASSQARHLT